MHDLSDRWNFPTRLEDASLRAVSALESKQYILLRSSTDGLAVGAGDPGSHP